MGFHHTKCSGVVNIKMRIFECLFFHHSSTPYIEHVTAEPSLSDLNLRTTF